MFWIATPVSKIKNECNVAIKIPSDTENSNTIRIEGDPNGVRQAKKELEEMAKRMVSWLSCYMCFGTVNWLAQAGGDSVWNCCLRP